MSTASEWEDQRWTVADEPVGGLVATRLLRRYYEEIVGRYYGRAASPSEVRAALRAEPSGDLTPPTGRFLVAVRGGAPAGCVGVRLLTATVAELTRLYVEPAARGGGGGALLLAAAEQAARDLGRGIMRLDTRHDLVEARALYSRLGYAEIPPYNNAPYADHWFEKALYRLRPASARGPRPPRVTAIRRRPLPGGNK